MYYFNSDVFTGVHVFVLSSLTEVPIVDGSEITDHFRILHEEANEFDAIHDVILQVSSLVLIVASLIHTLIHNICLGKN